MYAPTPIAMMTQAATAAPAMALAGMTPLSGDGGVCAPEVMPFGAATAREGVGVGLVDRVVLAVCAEVAVPVPVPVPVPVAVAEAPGDASEVGASLGPDPVPVGVPVAELDAT
jgi:hypothetical protein